MAPLQACRATYDGRTGVHRPFFRAGIAVLLTAGAVWGAVLLLRIAISGSFTAISIHDVNAHGHAQIFGWVGLFVMGFAYQMFLHWPTATKFATPRPVHRPRLHHSWKQLPRLPSPVRFSTVACCRAWLALGVAAGRIAGGQAGSG